MVFRPFIIGTFNSKDALHAGVDILKNGGSAIDAIEACIRLVEANPNEMTVGLGGIPNILGVPELDASIMDGRTLKSGAVAAVQDYLHVISIARKVMELTPHVLLVGEGAEMFAATQGFEKTDLRTEDSIKIYEAFVNEAMDGLSEELKKKWPHWSAEYARIYKLPEWRQKLTEQAHGTVNFIAMDEKGDICSGASTSGTAFKFPGRVGDSAVIGAGNYCDNRFGGATCIGRGELTIRLSTAHTIVSHMKNGLDVREACIRAMKDIHGLHDVGGVHCLAIDTRGNAVSASTSQEIVYYYMNTDSKGPEERKAIHVKAGD